MRSLRGMRHLDDLAAENFAACRFNARGLQRLVAVLAELQRSSARLAPQAAHCPERDSRITACVRTWWAALAISAPKRSAQRITSSITLLQRNSIAPARARYAV